MNFKSIIILLLLGLFIITCLQNIENVSMSLLFWKFEISKLLLLILTLIAGIVIGMIIPGVLKKAKEEKDQEKKQAAVK
ncbi:MAG: DUF1049 domain-containing protein [Ignavibacteriota bacterium]|nr:DUF1049 domain-containing protein [Ignavibacteriota bacterium]MBW7841955.1 DUF1049 domain-containing protein [Ignavibacterium sp.]MCO6447306.1 DUF1049 domain-containing protein [Ignavibacterium album]MCZ2268319.1 DUF1049 domain-containing protein [Ignavibacteriales bacterium]HOJ08705.1 DUF1049 domain-containing protein [Ignavibacteriaceae bacterium]